MNASRKHRAKSNSSHKRRLRFEPLEPRRLLSCTPGGSDVNDQTCETDLTLTVGQTLPGTISPNTDVDLYELTIDSLGLGVEHTFTAADDGGDTLDTYLRLFDANGNELEDDDDGGPDVDSELNFTFTTTGTYYLGISSASNENYDAETGLGDSTGNFSSTGGYFITFEDTNDEIDEAILNDLNNGFGSGRVDPNTDVDLFRFDAVGGQSFRFEVDGDRVGSTGLDSYLRIFDDNGNPLANDDDGGTGLRDSELTFTFPSTDDYYVGVSSASNLSYDVTDGTGDTTGTFSSTGFYTITATEVSLDTDDRLSNAIDLGNLFTDGTRNGGGVIDTDTDVDLYQFEVGRDGSYVEIDIDVPTLGLDSLLRLFNASGSQIALNEDGNAAGEIAAFPRDSVLLLFLNQGTYYAGVSGADNTSYDPTTGLGDTDGNATGSYTIKIQDRLHVDTAADALVENFELRDSDNTLREALFFANGNPNAQTITFQPSVFASGETITLSVVGTNQLEITDSISIEGPGADLLSISGNDNSRVLLIDNGDNNTEIDVTISGVTIRDGNTGSDIFGAGSEPGAGVRNRENLTLDQVVVTSNTSFRFGTFFPTSQDHGGGIYHSLGTLNLSDSTISGNTALASGGIRIFSGSAEITNSTFSGNSAQDTGAGVGASGSSTVTVRSSTFTGNRANNDGSSTEARGGGLFAENSSTLTLHNSIVAGNFTGTGNQESNIDKTSGATVSSSSSHNLIGGSSPGISNGVNGNIVGNGSGGVIPIGTILNTTLANNGGPTLTHVLVVGSPAINKGNNAEVPAGVTTDQRGAGFARIFGGTVDIGAVESPFDTPTETPSLIVTIAADDVDNMDGETSLREAVFFANSTSALDTITFVPGLSGQTILLEDGQLPVTASLTIAGLGADNLTISGNNASRIFLLGSSNAATYTIANVTLTNGAVPRGTDPSPETGGAIRLNDANDTLIIDRSVISSSVANGGGAILIAGGATLQVIDSALINNEANFSGSAILTGGSTDVTIVNSTVSGNESLNNSGAIFQQTGGALDVATMLLRNVTVANNTGVGVQSFAGSGTSDISIGNSLIAGNTSFTLASGGAGTTTFTSLGNNLLDSINTAFSGPNDQIDPAPMIGTLTSNGGPTPTHALLTGSPAVNMGSNALALDADDNLLLTDQRGTGFDRIKFGTVDIGAFESQTVAFSADFDNDSDVDGSDFLIWQNGFGTQTGATLSEGDADGDADVDGSDFLIWQINFGNGVGAGAARIVSGTVEIGAFENQTLASSADFDNGGDVDGSDSLIWQNGFGTQTSATLSEDNVDEDANVDGSNLLIWQNNFGNGGGAGTALAPTSQDSDRDELIARDIAATRISTRLSSQRAEARSVIARDLLWQQTKRPEKRHLSEGALESLGEYRVRYSKTRAELRTLDDAFADLPIIESAVRRSIF